MEHEKIPALLMADLSTAHVQQADAPLLDEWAKKDSPSPLVVYSKGEYGWFVHLQSGAGEQSELAMREAGASDALVNLVHGLHERGFHFLNLDRDAEETGEFPVFEW